MADPHHDGDQANGFGGSPFSSASFAITGATAVVAAISAVSSAMLGLEVWAMFLGWVVFFSRPTSFAQGLASMLCYWLGMVIALASVVAAGKLVPLMGPGAFGPVVFLVAIVVLSMRFVPLVNNIASWFVGLSAFYAAHLGTEPEPIVRIGLAGSYGVAAAWIAMSAQTLFQARKQHHAA